MAPPSVDPVITRDRGGTIVTTLTGRSAEVAEVAERLGAAGVKYAAISFVDVHGKPKAKMVPLNHLDQAARGSEMFTGAALDGVPQDVNDDEVAPPHPDLDAAIIAPFNREVAWFPPGDLWVGDTPPFEACSRQILKRVTADAATLGYTFNLGIETEFFLLTDDRSGVPQPASLDDDLAKPCYDLRTMLHNLPVVDEIVSAMNELGWDVYSFDHEDGNGQFETDFTYTDAVAMADRLVFFRMMVGEIARKHGLFASWMPSRSPTGRVAARTTTCRWPTRPGSTSSRRRTTLAGADCPLLVINSPRVCCATPRRSAG